MYMSDIQIQSTMSECITNKDENGHKKRSNNKPRTALCVFIRIFTCTTISSPCLEPCGALFNPYLN